LLSTFAERGYQFLDMTDDEVAKLHVRHMIGGHGVVNDERLFRFWFPERPGALLNFLTNMGQKWNISLFHYRSHGAAYGRVLVGMQIPPAEENALNQFLEQLGYLYVEETDNPAYQRFLS